ncbi:uncharacterized protein BYT42DRAFT_579639 [Radiomyces spectabilis]|uniref:uncharacterized protein n=1 Tax=Radiomyces spectabilis TaxID=64574 RepID=UPI002220B1BE|nr:uncharacterized protein BYT42DRAFT_579639 [Radiomyces spectabilis]KAI8373222.1 hypothetical protein BYT42DRAFT_579639 [Radiomyces spectabilis]
MSDRKHDMSLESLLALLKQRNDNPRDIELETRFYNDVLVFLLSDAIDHWWCSESVLPIAKESLWFFSLPDVEHIVQYKQKLDNILKKCLHCSRLYHTSKSSLRERYADVFTKENVDNFFTSLSQFDEQRILSSLQQSIRPSPFVLTDTTLCAISEIILAPCHLANPHCDQLLCDVFVKIQHTGMFPTFTTDHVTGIILMAIHHHKIVRFWARKLLDKFLADGYSLNQDDYSDVKPFVRNLILQFSPDAPACIETDPFPFEKATKEPTELWKALRAIISIIPANLLSNILDDSNISMLPLLRHQLSRCTNSLPEILKTMAILLVKLGPAMWGQIEGDNKPYYDIVKSICDHVEFHEAMKIAQKGNSGKILQRDGNPYPEDKLVIKMKSVLEWIHPFWATLRMSSVREEITNKILDLVLGYFQEDIWATMCKAYCADIGFRIIEQSVLEDNIPATKINEYASVMITFADFRSDQLPPSLYDVPATASNVIRSLLETDSRHLGDVFTLMSDQDGQKELKYVKLWQTLRSSSQSWITHRSVSFLEPVLIAYANIMSLDIPTMETGQHPLLSSTHGKSVFDCIAVIHSLVEKCLRSAVAAGYEACKSVVLKPEMLRPWLYVLCAPHQDIRGLAMQVIVPSTTAGGPSAFEQFFNRDPPKSLETYCTLLEEFNSTSLGTLNAFSMVNSINQSLSQILQALIGSEEGYLLRKIVNGEGYVKDEHLPMMAFWENSWQTISLLLASGLTWAESYKPKAVVDVILVVLDIAYRLTASRQLFQKAIQISENDQDMDSSDLALGYDYMNASVDSLSHWIYVTRQEVLQRLLPLLSAILKQLRQAHLKISIEAYDRLMTAATGVNASRLTAEEKEHLFMELSAHEPMNTIFIDDSDDENIEWQTLDMSPRPIPSYSAPTVASTSSSSKARQITLDEAYATSSAMSSHTRQPASPQRATSKAKITSYFNTTPTTTQTAELSATTEDDDNIPDEFSDVDFSQLPEEWFQDVDEPKRVVRESKGFGVSPRPASTVSASPSRQAPPKPSNANNVPPPVSSYVPKPKITVQRVFPKTQQQTYAVTSTGRKLKPPPMGFSKMKALRDEFRAERKLSATVRSPSAAASLRRQRGNDSQSSDSDSSSSDDENDASGLLSLVQDVDQAKNKSVEAESSSMKALFEQKPKRTTKLIDSPMTTVYLQKRMKIKEAEQRRRKITPDIDRMYKTLLSWDITDEGDMPPNVQESMYTHVKDRYTSFRDYVTVFEPLLLLEAWMQIVRAKEALTDSDVIDRVLLESRCHVNDFVDVTFAVQPGVSSSMMPDDLMCIANHFGPEFFGAKGTASAVERTSGWKGRAFLGKVTNVVQKKNMAMVTLRCYFTPDRITLLNSLSPKTTWRALRLMSLTTAQREYSALQGLEYYDLAQHILNPKPTVKPSANARIIQEYIRRFGVNEPQAEAIAGAINRKKGFTLIQGPPGTGKTKTILGLIACLLDEQSSRQFTYGNDTNAKRGKLLVCAPSNAAVDEIAKRLKDGIATADGLRKMNVVRVGVIDSVNASVKDLVLERLIEKELEPSMNEEHSGKKWALRRDRINEDLRKVQLDLEEVEREIAEAQSDVVMLAALRDKRKGLFAKKDRCRIMLKSVYDDQRDYSREQDISRIRARQKILGNADVVCATLSGSGHEMLTSLGLNFETVVVDEAAQSIEISSLIPLKYDCQRCVLVGDPNQLPPTVLSIMAAKYSYEQSLFMRLQKNCPDDVYLLSIQYRMHPQISAFPSKLFYDSRLLDGPDMATISSAVWHSKGDFPPYCFYNIVEGHEKSGYGKSMYNVEEAEAAVALVDMLASQLPGVKFAYRIGVITPYKQQLSQLKSRFERRFGSKILDVVDFNTVDGFQGQEKDIIIFSCVRAGADRGIGFLADIRRMNVGLTRARKSLFVLGHAGSLYRSQYWGDLVRDATQRNLLIDCKHPYFDHKMVRNHVPSNLFAKETVVIPRKVIGDHKRKHAIELPKTSESPPETANDESKPSEATDKEPDVKRVKIESDKPSDQITETKLAVGETSEARPDRSPDAKRTLEISVEPTDKEWRSKTSESHKRTRETSHESSPNGHGPPPEKKLTLAEYRASRGLPPLDARGNKGSPPIPRRSNGASLFIPKKPARPTHRAPESSDRYEGLSARERVTLEVKRE